MADSSVQRTSHQSPHATYCILQSFSITCIALYDWCTHYLCRLDEAIEILEYIVRIREDMLGTANPDVDDEKRRLAELLKEAGRARNRKAKSLETLLDTGYVINKEAIKV